MRTVFKPRPVPEIACVGQARVLKTGGHLSMQTWFKLLSFIHPTPSFLHSRNVNNTLELNLSMDKPHEAPVSWSF